MITKEIKFINREKLEDNEKNSKTIWEKSSDNSLLSIENLNYEYNGRDGFQLRNINFSINQGKKIAITGKTGSGKAHYFI